MSQVKLLLSKLIPRFGTEANKIRESEARSRWMKIKKITESPKSLSAACRFYGMSEDAYLKWGSRLLKQPRAETLLSRSRKPHRSPNKTKPRNARRVFQLRRFDPSLGPDRISDELKRNFKTSVPPSTVYAILKREKLVSQKLAQKLTKKHLKRYRRPLPGFLQMDFKYVPYLIEGKQFYQLSCVDHHSSWRFIRMYRTKDLDSVMSFLKQLLDCCPFPIIEIQTDNDTAFTDKFSSQRGVTGEHQMDLWCQRHNINHRLIPVGVKELNGKVENTHKQDDREFFARGPYKTFESLSLNSQGYNHRWNSQRRTKALHFLTPDETVEKSYVLAIAMLLFFQNEKNTALHRIDSHGNTYMPINKPKAKKNNRTRKLSIKDRYLLYLDWLESKKIPAIYLAPPMFQSYSQF